MISGGFVVGYMNKSLVIKGCIFNRVLDQRKFNGEGAESPSEGAQILWICYLCPLFLMRLWFLRGFDPSPKLVYEGKWNWHGLDTVSVDDMVAIS